MVVQLRGEVVVHEEQVAHLLGVGLPVQAREARLVQLSSGRATATQGPLGMGSGHMALQDPADGLLRVVVLLAQLGVVGLSEGLEDAAQPAHDGGPHVPVGLLVGDEVNGCLAGASAELAPLTCYADLEVYSTPAPTVQQQPARQTVAASSCYVAVGRCGYVPPEELRLRLTHHERDSDKYHAVRAMLDDLLKLADHYLTWRRRTRPVSMRREELEHRAATHCRECLMSRDGKVTSRGTLCTEPSSCNTNHVERCIRTMPL